MKPRSFTFLLPLSALLISILLPLIRMGWAFFALKHAAHGSNMVVIGTTANGLVVPSHDFLRFSFMAASLRSEELITILNFPAHFVDLLISYLIARKPFWRPGLLGTAGWLCLTYPFFALPAWVYVGFGVDAFLQRKSVCAPNMIVSLILTLIFGAIAAVLYFGLRNDPGLVPGSIAGLTLWTFLSSTPFLAWLRAKFRVRSPDN
jgi:hypothetical protein